MQYRSRGFHAQLLLRVSTPRREFSKKKEPVTRGPQIGSRETKPTERKRVVPSKDRDCLIVFLKEWNNEKSARIRIATTVVSPLVHFASFLSTFSHFSAVYSWCIIYGWIDRRGNESDSFSMRTDSFRFDEVIYSTARVRKAPTRWLLQILRFYFSFYPSFVLLPVQFLRGLARSCTVYTQQNKGCLAWSRVRRNYPADTWREYMADANCG